VVTRLTFARASAPPALAFVLACTFVLGCGLIKKKKDAGDDDEPPANAPTVTVTGTGAKNEKDILRYASETKLADEPATIGKDGTKVKTFPASGADITALAKGTAVVKIAKFFSTGVLVTFVDPTAADGSRLMGWIPPESLAAPGATATAAPVLTAPKVAAVDAGAKVVVADAGGAVAADAGKVVVDAGAPVQSSGTITALPTAGKCPAGMILVTPLCRRPCAADGDCPKGAFCTSSGGRKTCSATK
jgi:hypothetical protein